MMCFKIPSSVCKRISAIIYKFWWSRTNEGRAIHWVRNTTLNRAKSDGGFNFRDMELFNDALLAKQFWKLFSSPSSLVSRFFKARYFKESSILNSDIGHSPSYAWRSIWTAGMKLKEWMWQNTDGTVFWALQDHGFYTVRSAYHKLQDIRERNLHLSIGECSDKNQLSKLWTTIWRLKIQPKFKVFIWRLVHKALPVANNLRKRGIDVKLCCQTCGFKNESICHTFLQCWWAKCLWEKLGVMHFWEKFSFESIDDWFWFCINHFGTDTVALICIGAYMIWRNRNLTTHTGKGLDILQSTAFVRCRSKYYNNPTFKFSIMERNNSAIWMPPRGSVVKFNCDGSWIKVLNTAWLGCVLRDSFGSVLGGFATFQDNIVSSIDAEGLALCKAMWWATHLKFADCLFETDCLEVFNSIQQFNPYSSYHKKWLSDCAVLLTNNDKWELSVTCREGNCMADALARKAVSDRWFWFSNKVIPRFLADFV